MASKKIRSSYPDGLKQALLALACFRTRHDQKRLYAKAKGKNVNKTISTYGVHKIMAKKYIVEARAYGFRGSVWEAIQKY